jgi:hypothetical protein
MNTLPIRACYRQVDSRRHVQQNFDIVTFRGPGGFARSREDLAQITVVSPLGLPSYDAREFGELFPHAACGAMNVGSDPPGLRRGEICVEQHLGTPANCG